MKISREKSSNASAIVSLMRNLGGSIGIALVTNRLAHSQQIEQAYLVEHLSSADFGYRSSLATYSHIITNLGVPSAQATTTAMGKMYQELLHQASILAFRDAYNFLAVILAILAVAALLMPKNILPKEDNLNV
jgi:DHA2 family multidrug resistance protein